MSKYVPGQVPGKRRATFYLDEAVHQKLKMVSAKTGETQSVIAERALRRELSMMVLIREMTDEQLQAQVIGQHMATVLAEYDWADYYPLVDTDNMVIGVVDAQNDSTDGMVWDETDECYRYESDVSVCTKCRASGKGDSDVRFDEAREQWMVYRGGWVPCETCLGMGWYV